MAKLSKEQIEEIRLEIISIKEHFGMTKKKMCELMGNMNPNTYQSSCRANQHRTNFNKNNLLILKANLKKLHTDYFKPSKK